MMLFLPPMDILTCNSSNKQSFQNLTKGPFAQCSMDHRVERLYVRIGKNALLAELQA